MRTAQDQRFYIFEFTVAQIMINNRIGNRMVSNPFFNRRNQEWRRQFINLDKLIVLAD